jgi:hypothetical protein
MNTPEPGLYYHYKHNYNLDINNYAYEVLNIAHHTEINGLDEGAMVIYRPLYESFVYKAGKYWDARPLKMFMDTVKLDGKEIPRFSKITDPKIISELEKIKRQMYD